MPASARQLPVILTLAIALSACGGSAAPSAAPASSAAAAPASSAAAAAPASKPAASAAAKPSAAASGAASAKPAASAAASGLQPIKISIATKGSDFAWLYVAKDLGFFQNHGLDAQINVVSPANSVSALVSGDLDLSATAGTVIKSDLKGLPVKVILMASNKPPFVVVGAKGLTSLDELKGKVLSADAPQTTTRVMLDAMMKNKGIPANQYQVVTGTTDDARMAAVVNGAASAAIVNISVAIPFTKQGYPIIGRTTDLPDAPSSGLGTSQTELKTKRDLLKSALLASLESFQAFRTQKDKVVPVLAKEFDLAPDDAGLVFDTLAPNYTKDGRPSAAAEQFELESDQAALELKDQIKPERIYDFSLLDEIASQAPKS
ncbi:MAG TPA: ABC transporter substrate-binding protein [Chloroflexota bacterium]|nr:ABC transporter substrate-binding protein [Chloroflexota bacterium]